MARSVPGQRDLSASDVDTTLLQSAAMAMQGDAVGDVNGILECAGLSDPGLRLLVITFDAGPVQPDWLRECAVYVVPREPLTPKMGAVPGSFPAGFRLPIADGAFDVVLGYRLVRPGFDGTPLLREALRVLRRAGSLVLVTDPNDFRSAPLPPAGPAHLAQRSLAAAGIQRARFSQHGANSVAVVERCGIG